MLIPNLPHLQSHYVSDLASTDWQNVDLTLPATIAGRHLARKHNVPTSIADALAVIAGLGPKPEAN
jgi:hypothetical protein